MNCGPNNPATDQTGNLEKFTGDVWYVTKSGNDSNGGKRPDDAKLTIAATETAASANDKIIVGPGTYVEDVTIDQVGIELFGEIGTTIAGTLTISANSVHIEGMIISPTAAVGIDLNNSYCKIKDTHVVGTPTIGFDIDGAYNIITGCNVAGHTTTAFDVASNNVLIEDCIAHGAEAGTRGYYFSNTAADTCTLKRCLSCGNDTTGYEISSGCTHIAVVNCCSGGGDGARIDAGSKTQWCKYSGILPREHHEKVYPTALGEGVANAPINITNLAQDETGNQDDRWYWGEPKVLVAPAVNTAIWSLIGYNIFATTANKEIQGYIYRINNTQQSAKNGGNAWDEGATVLTVADGSKFLANDLVWIYSDYKTDGEIVKISSISSNEITIARETVASGRTGLRWDHTTNDAGTEVMYLVYRSTLEGMHPSEFDYSAGSAKDFSSARFHVPREFRANDGILVRILNMTDDLACEFDMTVLWED